MRIGEPLNGKTHLFAPAPYWQLSEAQRAEICNGCGTKGLVGALVPDTIYGLRVTPACNIHDFMYVLGATIADKESADRVFFNNLLRLIDAGTRWQWLKRLRATRARTYFQAVRMFGGPAFWEGKNADDEMGTA